MSLLFFSLFTITIVMITTYSKALQSCNVAHICKIVVEMMTSSLLLHLFITPTTTITKIERKNSLQLCKLSPLLLARPPTLTGGERSIIITIPSTNINLTTWEEKKSWGEQQQEQNIKPGRRETLAPDLAFFISGIVQPALGGKNYIVVIIVIIIFHHFDSIIITNIINM